MLMRTNPRTPPTIPPIAPADKLPPAEVLITEVIADGRLFVVVAVPCSFVNAAGMESRFGSEVLIVMAVVIVSVVRVERMSGVTVAVAGIGVSAVVGIGVGGVVVALDGPTVVEGVVIETFITLSVTVATLREDTTPL